MGNVTLVIVLLGVTFVLTQGRARATTLDKEIRAILIDLLEIEAQNKRGSEVRVEDINSWLKWTNEEYRDWQHRVALAEWNYATNITDPNRVKLSEEEAKSSVWCRETKKKAKTIRDKNNNLSFNTDRQLRLLTKQVDPTNDADVRQLKDLASRMSGIYSTARACKDRETCLQMEPGLQKIMATSRDPSELEWAWREWREVTGPEIKPLYMNFVHLSNKGARENGYHDYGAFWRDEQFDQTPNIEELCDSLWAQLRPMYLQLHAYVRRKLHDHYGAAVVNKTGPIPAHLLGNMWAQNWQMIADIVFPPATGSTNNIAKTAEHNLKNKFDVNGLFRLAEEFYTSIGLFPMTETFWNKSMVLKPADREVTCHASASDLFARDDFRIKMCTEVTMDYLYTIHHEMGHIEYFMAYSPQPAVYRGGANSGFHEAVGDTMTLSVVTRKHLQTINLIEPGSSSPDDDIADLLNMALYKIAFLPYGYLLDKWRWRVFSGEIPDNHANEEYWKLRLEYQGLVSPVPRSEEDFDPAAKYHVPANSAYMIYFVSFIAQFQFYQSLCEASGHQGPLHTCDFYQSKEAGDKLKSMLELGSSKPWQEALEQVTGSRELTVEPLLEYFKPLMDWLEIQNKAETLGWDGADINWRE